MHNRRVDNTMIQTDGNYRSGVQNTLELVDQILIRSVNSHCFYTTAGRSRASADKGNKQDQEPCGVVPTHIIFSGKSCGRSHRTYLECCGAECIFQFVSVDEIQDRCTIYYTECDQYKVVFQFAVVKDLTPSSFDNLK